MDQLAKDRELQTAVGEASTAERLAYLRMIESESGMEETNRNAWEAQKQVVTRLRVQHQALREAIAIRRKS